MKSLCPRSEDVQVPVLPPQPHSLRVLSWIPYSGTICQISPMPWRDQVNKKWSVGARWAAGRRKEKGEETKGGGQGRQTNLTLQRNLPLHIKELLLLLLGSLLSEKERNRAPWPFPGRRDRKARSSGGAMTPRSRTPGDPVFHSHSLT